MQGTWVPSLTWEDPTCYVATRPERHKYWGCTLESGSRNYWSLCTQSPRSTRVCVLSHSLVSYSATPQTIAHQALLFMASPRNSTGVDYHFFSRGSSWPRDRTWVSYIAGGFFSIWATMEGPQQEACTLPLESSPYLPQLEKSTHGYEDPAQPQINKLKGKPKYLECCAENSEQSRPVAALLRKTCFEGWHLGTWILRRFPPLPQADSLYLICLCKSCGLCWTPAFHLILEFWYMLHRWWASQVVLVAKNPQPVQET